MMQTISARAKTMPPVAILVRTAERKYHIHFEVFFLNHELDTEMHTSPFEQHKSRILIKYEKRKGDINIYFLVKNVCFVLDK